MLGRHTAFLHSDAGIGWIAHSSGTRILESEKCKETNIKQTHKRMKNKFKTNLTTG